MSAGPKVEIEEERNKKFHLQSDCCATAAVRRLEMLEADDNGSLEMLSIDLRKGEMSLVEASTVDA